MDVISRAVAFVEMPMAAKVEQVQFVDEAVMLQELERAIDGDARDIRVDRLCAFENFASIEVPRGSFHHLEHHTALARKADTPGPELALEAAGSLVNVDTFAGGNAVWGSARHS